LTAEKFVPDPFSEQPGGRLYRTGDLARYHSDGNLEFLGRADFQVKVRGYRIELGEIEAVLGQHPAVRENVVMAREYAPGDKRLVSYVVFEPDSAPPTDRLRAFLRDKLPDYMIPSYFIALSALPLNANGKVDRRSLPIPDRTRPDLEESYVAPRTATEELLVDFWSNVLGCARIGVNDSFFELGGHSLLATQLISRVRDAFQLDLPLRHIFEAPTVAGFAQKMLDVEARSGDIEQTARLLLSLNRMTDVEAEALLEKALATDEIELF
jgi:hypothetical protein